MLDGSVGPDFNECVKYEIAIVVVANNYLVISLILRVAYT